MHSCGTPLMYELLCCPSATFPTAGIPSQGGAVCWSLHRGTSNMVGWFLTKARPVTKEDCEGHFFGIVFTFFCESASGLSNCSELEIEELGRQKPRSQRILLFGSQYFWLFFFLNFPEIAWCWPNFLYCRPFLWA